jgi:hypothetical protein
MMVGPTFGLAPGWYLMSLNPKMLKIRKEDPAVIKA